MCIIGPDASEHLFSEHEVTTPVLPQAADSWS